MSDAPLPLPASSSTTSLVSPSSSPPPSTGSGPAVRVLSSQEDLASRPPVPPRKNSSNLNQSRDSLVRVSSTRNSSREALDGIGGAGSANVGAGAAPFSPERGAGGAQRVSVSSPGVAGILPSAAFLNARSGAGVGGQRGSMSSASLGGAVSSALAAQRSNGEHEDALNRPMSSAFSSPDLISTSPSSPSPTTSPYILHHSQPHPHLSSPVPPTSPSGTRRNGPVITRISSAMSPSLSQPPSSRIASPPASPRAPPPAHASRRSTDDLALSSAEVLGDLAAGGRLASQRRTSSESARGGRGGAGGTHSPALSASLSRSSSARVGGGAGRTGEPKLASGVVPAMDFAYSSNEGGRGHGTRGEFPSQTSTAGGGSEFDSSSTMHGGFSAKPSQEPLFGRTMLPPTSSPPTPSVPAPHNSRHQLDADKSLPFSSLPLATFHPMPRSPSLPSRQITPELFPVPSHTFLHIPITPLSPPRRIYASHPGNNSFPLRGWLLTSGDKATPFMLAALTAAVVPVLWWVFNGEWLWRNLGGGGKASLFIFAYLVLIMWTSMLKTAWSDPGILPRNLDPTPPRKFVPADDGDVGGAAGGEFKAEPKYVRVKEGVVASKWCETCHTYRPPRTSHCRLCDNCIEHTDHHCAFLNNCIGRHNYLPFLSFLLSSVLCALYSIAFSVYHVYSASTAPGSSLSSSWQTIGALVVAILSFGLLLPVGGLGLYHAQLCFTNRTTVEMLRPSPHRSTSFDPATGLPLPGNVWALSSPWRNFIAVACRPERGWEGGLGRRERRRWVGRDAREEWGVQGKEGR